MRRCLLWGAVLAAAVAVPVDSDIQQLQSDADALLADAAASDGERGGEDASQGDGDMANFEKGKHNWADATIYELDRKTLKGDIVTSFDLNTVKMGDVKHASKGSPSLAGTFHTTIHSPLKSAGAEQWELGTHKGKPGLRYNMADGDTRFFPLRASKLLSGGKLATVYSTRHSSGTSHMGLERDGATDPIGATAQSLEMDWDANNAPADDAHDDATFGEVADADADQADALVNQDAPADGAAGEGEGGDGMGGEYERSGRHQASHGPKGGIPISRLAGSMEKAQAKRFTNGLHKFGITKWGMSDAPGYNGLTFLAHGPKHTNAHTNVHNGHAGSTAKKLGVHWNSHEREEEGAGHVAVAKPAKLH